MKYCVSISMKGPHPKYTDKLDFIILTFKLHLQRVHCGIYTGSFKTGINIYIGSVVEHELQDIELALNIN